MNKTKKIAMAVVSTVMAGTMVFGLTACGDGDGDDDVSTRSTTIPTTRFNADASALTNKTVGGLQLSVLSSDQTKIAYPAGTQLSVNIIDSGNVDRQISYQSKQISGAWTSIDGYTYRAGDLKPAWWQFGQTLGIKFVDNAKPGRKGAEIDTVAKNTEWSQYNFINGSMGDILANTDQLVNLTDYLDYMPNFKAFLDSFDIVKWSLTMDDDGAMYYLPYFDGNDDIEKYVLIQKQWTRQLLDDAMPATDTSITFLKQATDKGVTGESTSVTAFMGSEDWDVVAGDNSTKIYVRYSKALADAKASTDGSIGKILADDLQISDTSSLQSGNIVDIMNFAINQKNGEVKGSVLTKILRRYIDVAYTSDAAGTTKFYTNRSDVFNSVNAAWDADLMTAMFRCVVTNYNELYNLNGVSDKLIYALQARELKTQRENDLISLAGELYGARGLESRLEYYHIDENGDLKDARTEKAAYDAALKLNDLVKEGLMYTMNKTTSYTVHKYYDSSKESENVTFMLHDYAQTQTADAIGENSKLPSDFDFAPILTPVSKWNDGTGEKIMRFTESWRGVKNSGVVIPTESVKDPKVFSAVLSFVDYLYSNDGQIVGSYGPMATNADHTDGFWYGNPVNASVGGVQFTNGKAASAAQLAACTILDSNDDVQYFVKGDDQATYFMYDNTLYTSTKVYKAERAVPMMTKNNLDYFEGKVVNGTKMDEKNKAGYILNHKGKYTDYARGVVGAALPIGNKDQSFEWQCTAQCAIDGSDIVSQALKSGAIQHLTQTVDKSAGPGWYTLVPSCLPVSSTDSKAMGNQEWLMGSSEKVGVFNPGAKAGQTNLFVDLAFFGLGDYFVGTGKGSDTESGSYKPTKHSSTQDYVSWVTSYNPGSGGLTLSQRNDNYTNAYAALKTLYITAS